MCFLGRQFKYVTELHLRLFNKTRGGFTNAALHEKMQINGAIGTLKHKILHYSYQNLEHFFYKFNSYTSIVANSDIKKGKQAHKALVGINLVVKFLILYFLRLNFLNGYAGFVWAVFGAFAKFARQCKQIELCRIQKYSKTYLE
jgi:hypothetical protein